MQIKILYLNFLSFIFFHRQLLLQAQNEFSNEKVNDN